MNTYFAQVIEGRVQQVIVADQEFINSGVVGPAEQWIETTMNTAAGASLDGGRAIRYNTAERGWHYDAQADAFYRPQPWPSWTLDTTRYVWVAPEPYPESGGVYQWNEAEQQWQERTPLA